MGDGYCDDVTNNEVCSFDGGDCCLENVIIDYCTECLCLDSGSVTTPVGTTTTTTSPTTTATTTTVEGGIDSDTNDSLM